MTPIPKDIYVTQVKWQDQIVCLIEACNVPPALAPEVRYTRADIVERLKKMVKDAYSEGFSAGMDEERKSVGGKTWPESRVFNELRLLSAPLPLPSQPEGK